MNINNDMVNVIVMKVPKEKDNYILNIRTKEKKNH